MTIVISVEHLTKQYDLGVIGTGTLTRDLNRWWARVRKQPDPYTRIGQPDAFARIGESILALDDVSFTVQQGEALGIIGRNGAGKSTLLKILSRVTAPTSGVVKVRGRIGSLLEVGTGFHPELTGRENVYLNGAILGMKKVEITRRFDEIVDFAGVEKFIDTPVKRYSSGMYVRLAFAVAAHLDPEILIVDEVLAVGDAEFQKKCLGKMGDVAGEGRTVLFVSHNMGAIRLLCKTSILLKSGSIFLQGNSDLVVKQYLETGIGPSSGTWFSIMDKDLETQILEVQVKNSKDEVQASIDSEEDLRISIKLKSKALQSRAQIHLRLTNQEGISVFTLANTDNGPKDIPLGQSVHTVNIPGNFLRPGSYSLTVAILEPNIRILDIVENIPFKVSDSGNHATIKQDGRLGVVTPIFNWKVDL